MLVVAGQRQGLSSAGIGALIAAFGACAPPRRACVAALPPHALGAGDSPARALDGARNRRLRPLAERLRTDGRVHGAGNHAAGDRLRGRGLSHRRDPGPAARPRRERQEHDLAARCPARPAVAGLLLASTSARATVAFFAVFTLALALWGTLSPSIRRAPSLDELDALPRLGRDRQALDVLRIRGEDVDPVRR